MVLNKLKIVSFLVFATISSSCADAGEITAVDKLLIDTDAGADDAGAIILAVEAMRSGDIPEIIAITCVNGNTNVSQVAINVLKTLKVVDGLDIPVYVGATRPLIKPASTDYYFGQDGFGDFEYPDPPSTDLIQSEHAVNAMIDLVKEYPNEITILALGPLTNIALAIRLYPSFLDEIQQLIVMGGSTAGIGNALPSIEFNFFADPHANHIVFNDTAKKPTTLVPIETTNQGYLDMDLRLSLNETDNAKIWLINHAGALTLDSSSKWHSADAVATAVVLAPDSIVTGSDLYHSEAITDGEFTAGLIIVDYTNLTSHGANTNLITGVDRVAFEKLFLKYFMS